MNKNTDLFVTSFLLFKKIFYKCIEIYAGNFYAGNRGSLRAISFIDKMARV